MNEKIELDEKTLDIIRRNNKLTLSVRTAMGTLERTLFTKNDLTIFFFNDDASFYICSDFFRATAFLKTLFLRSKYFFRAGSTSE